MSDIIALPKWLIKPNHSERVIATSRGWEVESTGEILVAVKDLDKRIEAYVEELQKVIKVVKEATREKPGRKKNSDKVNSTEE